MQFGPIDLRAVTPRARLAFRKRQQTAARRRAGCDRTGDATMAASDFFCPCPKFASRAAIMARCDLADADENRAGPADHTRRCRGLDQWTVARLLNARHTVRGKRKSLTSRQACGDNSAFMRAR